MKLPKTKLSKQTLAESVLGRLRSLGRTSLVAGLAIIAFIFAGGLAVYYRHQYVRLDDKTAKIIPNENEVDGLVAQIGKFLELPVNERPTLATVSDVEKLRDQPFFFNAQNGDKVLIYATAGKAILFNPVSGKVIEVAPLGSQSPVPGSKNK